MGQREAPVVAIHNGKADAWRQRIEAQRASGQSVRAWCSANGAAEHSFYWWRRRLENSTPSKLHKPPVASVGLARVKLALASPADSPPLELDSPPIRLRLAADRELILPASMPMADIAALIGALERQA
jgi:transposase-like protein